MNIEIEGLKTADRLLRTRILGQMDRALRGVSNKPGTALVNFTDINGPKGGVDQRCGLTVRLPGRRTVHVEETATNPAFAFAAAADALERTIQQESARTQAARRRPKKYYAAQQLLVAEPGAGIRERASSTRRRRRAPVR